MTFTHTTERGNMEQPEGQDIELTEVNRADMQRGIDYEEETPEEGRSEGHPTPDHPTGRMEP